MNCIYKKKMFSFSVDAPIFRSSSWRIESSTEGDVPGERGPSKETLKDVLPQIRNDKRKYWIGAVGLGVTLLLLYAWLCFARPFGETFTKDFSNFLTASLSSVSALACFLCAYARRDANKVWRLGCLLSGIGWGLNAAGECVWLVVETLQRRTVPATSLADVGYISSYFFMIAGMGAYFCALRPTRRALTALDSALLAGAFGALTWFFILQPVWLARDINAPFATYIALLYPLYAVLLLWGSFALLYSPPSHKARRRAAFLIGGVTAGAAFANLWYDYLSVDGSYVTGSWNDLAFAALYISNALALLAITWDRAPWGRNEESTAPRESPAIAESSSPDGEFTSLRRVLLPYCFTLSAFGLIALHQWHHLGTLRWDLMAWCVVFLCIIMGRQMLSLGENLFLARQLRELNAGLDKQVRDRTRQIDALLQLTKAVNASLVESEVLAHAVSSARRAVPMNVAAVWNWNEDGDAVQLAVAEGAVPELESLPSENLRAFLSGKRVCHLVRQVAQTGGSLDCCSDELGLSLQQEHPGDKAIPCLHLEPILFNGHVLGVLGAFRLSPTHSTVAFTPEESRLLESVGLEVGTALENARIYSRAVEAADRDPATGLLNHRALQGRFDTLWERAQNTNAPLSVVMMDLNNFKNFNDLYGHLVGDEVLRIVARVLTETCRGEDIVARYGGDEFFMLLPNTNAEGALRVAQRLQQHMEQVEFRPASSREALPLSLSFGVATAPDDAHSKMDLIAAADKNLYVAKGSREAIRSTSSARQKRLALLREDGVAALDAMVTAVSNADAYTRQHSEDVTDYALWIAEELGLDDETRRTIEVGGMLHDVGKICVPQDVLKKPGRLTEAEFAAMQTHPSLGALLVGAVLPDAGVLQIVRSHHERYDGRGYPDALKGEDIPFLGRIVAVADAFSAMTTSRPYRKALSFEQARHEIERGIGTQFDPHLAEAFIRALDKRHPAS